jgi:hypothetical protein
MTSFYDKYLINKDLQNNNNIGSNIQNQNILKKDYTLNYSDYQKLKISEQYNKIYNEVYQKNKEEIILNENTKIYNLSFNILLQNAGKVYISILNDLSIFFSDKNKDKTINKLGYIFTKEDNLLYVGLLILLLAFLLWLIDITK